LNRAGIRAGFVHVQTLARAQEREREREREKVLGSHREESEGSVVFVQLQSVEPKIRRPTLLNKNNRLARSIRKVYDIPKGGTGGKRAQ